MPDSSPSGSSPPESSTSGSSPSAPPSLDALVHRALQRVSDWEASWGAFESHDSLSVDPERLDDAMDRYLERLTGNYPFHHPRYAGQMLKPPHPVAVSAYLAAMRINPNNHALDGGPPTSQMEKEVVADLAGLFDFPEEALGHLTSGGTVANLEALWVARHLHPGAGIAASADAHYTHGRMGDVLDVDVATVPSDSLGRIDLDALEHVLETQDIGTVVLTAATTGLGAVDPIADALPICRRHGARVHVDAAYGGFFRLHAGTSPVDGLPAEHLTAIAEADSVVVDPHKHGLQPYGCGCVLFRDPTVGRFYQHDSPYTYFTSGDLHLGEISLECSRAGAAAGALWCTLEALPLEPDDGLGPILAACLQAARRWADQIRASDELTLYAPPETDIVAYFPTPDAPTLSAVHEASQAVFDAAMNDPDDPVFVSLYRLPAEALTKRHPSLEADREEAAILRSVLMKPEHDTHADRLVDRLAETAREVGRMEG